MDWERWRGRRWASSRADSAKYAGDPDFERLSRI